MVAAVDPTASASLFVWPDCRTNGANDCLLLVELSPEDAHLRCEGPNDVSFGSPVLSEDFQMVFGLTSRSLLAEFLRRNDAHLSFLLIAIDEPADDAIEEAIAWQQAGRASGAIFTIVTVPLECESTTMDRLRRDFDTVLAADCSSRFHAARLFLEHGRIIGYDAADVMGVWRGRIGWVERSDETAAALAAVVHRARSRFGMAHPRAVSLLFDTHSGAPFIGQRDDLVTALQAALTDDPDILVAVNEPLWGHGSDGAEVSVLFAPV